MAETNRIHFHAGHNDAGYLPEADVETFDTFDDAKAYQIDELLRAADSMASWSEPHDCDDIPCPTYGDECPENLANSATFLAEELNLVSGPAWCEPLADGRALPTHWWISPCAEPDCAPEPDEETARRLASEWHGGQWSALYAFASSGHVRPDLRAEVEREVSDEADRAYLLVFLGPEPDPFDDVPDEAAALAYLLRYGNLSVPCSRYGRDTAECAPVAWALAQAIEEANGEATTFDGLEHLMGLVVNDHDDVAELLGDDDDGPEPLYVRRFDGLGDTWEVRWHGGSTFNVYSNGRETDVFTRYGDDQGNPPTIDQARRFIEEWAAHEVA